MRAIVGLAESTEANGQVFNIGSTEEVTILQLAHKVLKLAGRESAPPVLKTEGNDPEGSLPERANIRFVPYEQAYEEGFEDLQRRVPDITRIRSLIGWRPEISLDETISRVIRHYESTVNDRA